MTLTVPTRADHLAEVLAALYPAPYSTGARGPVPQLRGGGSGRVVADYRIVPHRRRPRLLVPAHLAAAGLRAAAPGRPTTLRLAATALRVPGMAAALLPDRLRIYGPPGADCLARYLATVLDEASRHALAILVGGPARANRKPVVALLNLAGEPAGFAKLGTGELTRALVRTERTALTALSRSPLRHVEVPALRHGGVWREHAVVVQSALPAWRGRSPAAGPLGRAMAEVARSAGTGRGRLASGPYWRRLRASAENHPRLRAALHRLAHRAGEVELEYGVWHGDWAPWNCRQVGDRVLVWDWERYATGIPLGYDALHHELARRQAAGPGSAGALGADLVRRAPALLAPFGVPAPAAEATAALYLIEAAARYLNDGQRTPAARAVLDSLGAL